MSTENLQKMYMEYQQLGQHIQQLQEQTQVLQQQFQELNNTLESLSELKNVKKDTEIMVPVAQGIYAKAKIVDTDKFLVNAGSNVVVSKDNEQTKGIISKQISEMQAMMDTNQTHLAKHMKKANELEAQLQKAAASQ